MCTREEIKMSKRLNHEAFNIIKRVDSRSQVRYNIGFNFRELQGVLEEILTVQKRLAASLNYARDRFSQGKYYDRAKEGKYRR